MSQDIKKSPFGSLLVYKRGYTADDVRSIIRERNLLGLRIFAELKEDRLPDVDFLREYSFLEALNITSVDDYDFSFLHHLPNLKELSISNYGKNAIDLANQTNLESFTIQWRKDRIIGLENCQKLRSLCLVEFAEDDFSAVNMLGDLTELKVKTSTVRNLNGTEKFANLKSLLLGNCKRLSSISELKHLFKLTSLTFDSCPKIGDFEAVGHLSKIKELSISNCGRINSIDFVDRLSHLQRLSLLESTDVSDGNLIPAKKIKEVFYKHRKHYNIRIENKEIDDRMKRNREKLKMLFSSK